MNFYLVYIYLLNFSVAEFVWVSEGVMHVAYCMTTSESIYKK